MLEAYEAFGDYETMMELVQSMICHVAQKVLGTNEVPRNRDTELSGVLTWCQIELRDAVAAVRKANLSETDRQRADSFVAIRHGKIVELEKLVGSKNYWTIANLASMEISDSQKLLFGTEARDSGLFNDVGPCVEQAVSGFERMMCELGKYTVDTHINLTAPWRRAKYKDLVCEKAGADWFSITSAERRQRAHDLGAEIGKEYEDFEVTGAVFEKLIEPTLIQPTFVTHLPKELVPLAKLSPEDPTTVEVFECCINGQEIAPAYTEQNDPLEQRERLEHQAGGEQQKLDEDFLVALEHGMPPAGGMGLGIDRLCMMLLGQESIRDVILFPQLKPK
jgi:lysyl-tRNA synthetase class 2